MSLDIGKEVREGIVILEVKGRLIVGDPVTKLREEVSRSIGIGSANIILNLKDVDYMDSTGLGGMVICFTGAQKAGGALKLVHVNKRNLELLELTNLMQVFSIFADEQDAVNSFFPGRAVKSFDILSFIQEQEAGD